MELHTNMNTISKITQSAIYLYNYKVISKMVWIEPCGIPPGSACQRKHCGYWVFLPASIKQLKQGEDELKSSLDISLRSFITELH